MYRRRVLHRLMGGVSQGGRELERTKCDSIDLAANLESSVFATEEINSLINLSLINRERSVVLEEFLRTKPSGSSEISE